MAKVVTMGEIMLRLSTPGKQKYIQATQFDINYGGGEANVAVSLANYGHDAEFVTKVPNNPIGECAIASLRKYGVETKNIAKELINGILPLVAKPAAIPAIFASAIPQSICLSGYAFLKIPVLVASARSASKTTNCGNSSANSFNALP